MIVDDKAAELRSSRGIYKCIKEIKQKIKKN
jgi:hypothetical protein